MNILPEDKEKQMKERINEIEKIRKELKEEKESYENYFYEKDKQMKYNARKNFFGKCFMTLNMKGNEYSYIKAFKIINIVDSNNNNSAEVLAIIDGLRSSCFNEIGLLKLVLPLWSPNTSRLFSREDDLKVIDYYKEINDEEFRKLANIELKDIEVAL